MDIYRAYAEDHTKRFLFYFSYEPTPKEIIHILTSELGREPYIYDIFPEPNISKEKLKDILSVKTICGKEIFIPSGLEVTFIDLCRILFGSSEDE